MPQSYRSPAVSFPFCDVNEVCHSAYYYFVLSVCQNDAEIFLINILMK
jgi:hypothetical protein